MPYTTITSDFWGWYQRHNNRVIWKNLSDAGLDLFASGPNNNPQAFLELDNVLPAMDGGFNARWGWNSVFSGGSPYGSSQIIPTRVFTYQQPQLANDPTNTATTNLWLMTNDTTIEGWTDSGTVPTNYLPSSFSATPGASVQAVTSRGWFYYSNNKTEERKINPSYITKNTDSLMGIDLPRYPSGTYSLNYTTADSFTQYPSVWPQGYSNFIGQTPVAQSTGYGYITAPTMTIWDPTGAGSGANITLSIGPHGEVDGWSLTSAGTGYQEVACSVSAPPSGGVQAAMVVYIQTNTNAPNAGQVVGADFAGPMSFVAGRTYAVALQNSLTGHTSDVFTTDIPYSVTASSVFLNALTSSYDANALADGTYVPTYMSNSSAGSAFSAGGTQVELVISVPASAIDPQVDTVILLATSDGGGVGTLYQVATFPLTSFTLASGYYQMYYIDTMPDSYNDINTSGNTLLEADLWAYTDIDGTSFGIIENTPPTTGGFLYPTLHQGRMFATDGQTVFYSKSLDEVTTSTGLITSKWEECWPGDYQLPIALNNETILGLKSDGTNLHIGTDKSIYTLYGDGPVNFSVPAVAFAQTGILSNDCWSVVYAEGQPSGFVWITQDLKVMFSDFSTYKDIGTQIYPALKNVDLNKLASMKLISLTKGPYNLAFLQLWSKTDGYVATDLYPINSYPEFYVWESRLNKWFRWKIASGRGWETGGTAGTAQPLQGIGAAFVYQYPGATSAVDQFGTAIAPGAAYLFMLTCNEELPTPYYTWIDFLDPSIPNDGPLGGWIPWSVQTSWQDMDDPQAIKIVNEVEFTSAINYPGATNVTVSLYGASSEFDFAQFAAGTLAPLKTGLGVIGPIASLRLNKLYCAGVPTAAKYYSVAFSGNTQYGNNHVLSSFSVETYPMARI